MPSAEFVQRFFPDVTDKDAMRLMIGCTSFPFGSPHPEHSDIDWYAKQLSEVSQTAKGDVDEALLISSKKIERIMDHNTLSDCC